MIEVSEYNKLLNYTQMFCRYFSNLDHRELAHNILCSGEWEQTSTYNLCRKYAHYGEEKHIISIQDFKSIKMMNTIEHKYCYHCGQVLPLEYFMEGERIRSKCKEALLIEKRNAREALSDRYIKDVIRKSKNKKTIEETRRSIISRRTLTPEMQLKKKQQREKRGKEKLIKEVRDSYILDIFRKLKIPKETITPEMIEEKRQSILEKRAKKLKKSA